MRRLTVKCATAWIVACCMGHADRAAAAPAPPQVPYTAPPECPNGDAFTAELTKRSATPRTGTSDAHGGARARRFSAHIEKEGGVYVGELTVVRGETRGTRQVRNADCAAVVRSLAVFVALALSEEAEDTEDTAPASPEVPSPETPPQPPVANEPTEPHSMPVPSEKPPHPTATPTRRKPPQRRLTPAPTSLASPTAWRFDAGIQAQYTRMGANAWGTRVSAELSRPLATSPIVPALRLSWGFADFTDPTDAGDIQIRLRAARAEACGGVSWKRTHNSLCAAFDLGQLAVSSSGLPRNGRAESTWTAIGLTARTRITVVEPLGVELALGLFDPLRRAEFTLIDPVRQVYRVPAFGLEAQLGLAVSAHW